MWRRSTQKSQYLNFASSACNVREWQEVLTWVKSTKANCARRKAQFVNECRVWQEVINPNPNPDRSVRLQLKSSIPATLLANE